MIRAVEPHSPTSTPSAVQKGGLKYLRRYIYSSTIQYLACTYPVTVSCLALALCLVNIGCYGRHGLCKTLEL